MKITLKDVGYNRGYVIGPYLQERPGVNADIVVEEGEDQEACALKALHYLKSIADKFHKEANPYLYQEPVNAVSQWGNQPTPATTMTTTSAPYEINIQHEKMEIAIDNCTTIEDLKAWKETNPVYPAKISDHYNERLKILNNGS